MGYLEQKGAEGVLLTVYVQPRASHNKVAGRHGEALKICITAPPLEGKANAALAKFLAKLFGIPKSDILLHSGQQSRTKRFLLGGLSCREAEQILRTVLTEQT